MSSQNHCDHFDAVIVGARPAGSATAMLLACAGLDVLVVDRARYGDDTLSTHALMRGGVLQLHRWGLLGDIIAAGTPPITRTTFSVGPNRLAIPVKPAHGVDALYAPRRTVLDRVLADGAMFAGAEFRYETAVTGLLRDQHGRVMGITSQDPDGHVKTTTADITIGADGMGSPVARWVGAPVQRIGTSSMAFAYGYWTDLDGDGYEWFFQPGGTSGVIPTNDDQACVFVGTTPEGFSQHLVDNPREGYRQLLTATAPELSQRLASAIPPARLHRFAGRRGHLRQAWGPGWALVGDAGYFKDPTTAHGLTDALRDAELLANAVIEAAGGENEAGALARYETARNELSDELFTVTDAIASLRWDVEEISALLSRLSAALNDEAESLAARELASRERSVEQVRCPQPTRWIQLRAAG
jgi:flavin-dependent dehydrogenase